MLINLALTSYLIGNMTQLVSKGDSKTAQFREYLDAISKFMRQNGVKANLQQRVIKFIVLQNRLSITLRTEAMRELPSALRLPIREQLYQDLFSDIDIFRNVIFRRSTAYPQIRSCSPIISSSKYGFVQRR